MKMDRVFGNNPADTEFARLLEAENSLNNLDNAPHTGEWITGTIDTISKGFAFLNLGCKAEGFIELTELTDPEGNIPYQPGDTLKACVIGFDPGSGGARLSLKLQLGTSDQRMLREAAQFGLPVGGKVMESIKGGFAVDLMGKRAFCPISQMDTRRITEPADYLGQTFDFVITQYEDDGRNIVVSRRKLLEEKAAEIIKNLSVGSVIEGRISEVRDYGAMMELGGGMDGMIHVSELSHSRVNRPSDVIAVGDKVSALVLEADPARLRVSLSMKALEEDPWKRAERELSPGLCVDGIVTGLETFGAFVELFPGINGLLHISAIGQNAGLRIRHPREVLQIGTPIQVEIEAVDPIKRRISLSMPAAANADANTDADAAGAGVGGDHAATGAGNSVHMADENGAISAETAPAEGEKADRKSYYASLAAAGREDKGSRGVKASVGAATWRRAGAGGGNRQQNSSRPGSSDSTDRATTQGAGTGNSPVQTSLGTLGDLFAKQLKSAGAMGDQKRNK